MLSQSLFKYIGQAKAITSSAVKCATHLTLNRSIIVAVGDRDNDNKNHNNNSNNNSINNKSSENENYMREFVGWVSFEWGLVTGNGVVKS